MFIRFILIFGSIIQNKGLLFIVVVKINESSSFCPFKNLKILNFLNRSKMVIMKRLNSYMIDKMRCSNEANVSVTSGFNTLIRLDAMANAYARFYIIDEVDNFQYSNFGFDCRDK